MARPPMAATSARILAACPFKRPSSASACCAWPDFVDGFADSWPRYMDGEPTAEQWAAAKRDWTRGNTGWEAVQNAKLRARDAERAAAALAQPEGGCVMAEQTRCSACRVEQPVRLQGGLTNEQLREAWERKIPGVEPTDRELSAFALGVEVGDALPRDGVYPQWVEPKLAGWYECWAVDDRWNGEMKYRAWNHGCWWTPLKDGWITGPSGMYRWRGPVADVMGPAPDGTDPQPPQPGDSGREGGVMVEPM